MLISTDDVILLFYSDSYTIVKVKNQTSLGVCVSRQKGEDKWGGGGGASAIVSYLFPMDVMDRYLCPTRVKQQYHEEQRKQNCPFITAP